MLVISVRELWLPPSRADYTHVHVYSRTLSHGHEYARSRRSPRVSRDDGGRVYAKLRKRERCGPRVGRENREKFRTKESRRKKNCTCNYPSPRHVGKWDSFGQPDLLSFPRRRRFFTRNELISFLRLKKKRNSSDAAPCLSVRSVE